MICVVENVELRGIETKVSKQTNEPYAVIYFEDNTGKSNKAITRDLSLITEFSKGLVCSLICNLEISKFTKFEVTDIKEAS
jgi:hypothetical protein